MRATAIANPHHHHHQTTKHRQFKQPVFLYSTFYTIIYTGLDMILMIMELEMMRIRRRKKQRHKHIYTNQPFFISFSVFFSSATAARKHASHFFQPLGIVFNDKLCVYASVFWMGISIYISTY